MKIPFARPRCEVKPTAAVSRLPGAASIIGLGNETRVTIFGTSTILLVKHIKIVEGCVDVSLVYKIIFPFRSKNALISHTNYNRL